MKKLLHYVPVAIGMIVVMGAILMTGGFFDNQPLEFEDNSQVHAQTTAKQEPVTQSTKANYPQRTVPIYTIVRSTDPAKASATTSPGSTRTTAKTPTSTTTTTTTTTTGTPYKPHVGPSGRYSSMRVFLDLQRIIFYKVNPETGNEYEAYAVKCSTGTSRFPTPTSRVDKPFILGGNKSALTIFASSKSSVLCWVRYATRLNGSIWFHSVPYDYMTDSSGKGVFDPSRCYMYSGYDVLGSHTSSHGCIRLALRDAHFIYSNSYRGMPCFVLLSYRAVYPGRTPIAPAPLPGALKGPRNWDPTDPNWPGYQPQTEATTTTTPAATTEATTADPTTITTTSTTPTTESATTSSTTTTPAATTEATTADPTTITTTSTTPTTESATTDPTTITSPVIDG